MNITTGSILNNKYIVKRELGRGAMGNVYLVEDLKDKKQYAVKRLELSNKTGLDENKAKDIFFKEVEFISKFDHPGLPRSYGSFIDSSGYFLTMEYIPGKTLEDILDGSSGPVSQDKAIRWVMQIAEVLDYLHNSFNAPIVYRDLKPSNIIITPEGVPRVIDFGIARYFNPDKNTDTFRLGSPGYAAPEQYKNQGQSSPQTDVFSLGVILFQLLTGYDPTVTPFKFPPMNSLNPAIPGELEKIILRAIALKPLNRYISVMEFKETLEKYLGSSKNSLPSAPYFTPPIQSTTSGVKPIAHVKDLIPLKDIIMTIIILMLIVIFKPSMCPLALLLLVLVTTLIIETSALKKAKLGLFVGGNTYLNTKDLIGNPPLHRAIINNQKDVPGFLISYGAPVDAKNDSGEAPIHVAINKGNLSMVSMLIDKGSDINIKESIDGNTPLHIAVERGNLHMADFLIRRGANVNIKNDSSYTPLYIAVKLGQEKIVRSLLAKSADPNIQDQDGLTPLHLAVEYQEEETVLMLKKAGALTDIRDKTGRSPLSIATVGGYERIKHIL